MSENIPIPFNTKLFLTFTVLLITTGCSQPSADPQNESFEPRAITELRTRGIGSISLQISINNQLIIDTLTVGETETEVLIDSSLLQENQNNIDIIFSLVPSIDNTQVSSRQIAEANIIVPAIPPGSLFELPPIEYRYTDSDNDTIADIHELLIDPIDIDLDFIPNNEDSDSDGDGLTDALDTTPYGENLPYANTIGLSTVIIRLPDSTERRLPISSGTPTTWFSEPSALADMAVPVRLPIEWPFNLSNIPSESLAENLTWRIIDVADYVRTNCSDWRIGIDASSFESSLEGSALLYFRRFDSTTVVTPLNSGSINSLRSLSVDVSNSFDANTELAELDEALRFIIVAPLTTGWLTMWTDPSFAGLSCSINLTELEDVFEPVTPAN